MAKALVVIFIIILLAAAGGFGYLYLQKNNELDQRNTELATSNSSLTAKTNALSLSQNQTVDLKISLIEAKIDIKTLTDAKTNLEADLAGVQLNLTNTQASLTTLQASLTTLQASYDTINTELVAMKKIYPPGDFTSLAQLIQWVTVHKQPASQYLDISFRSALKVQAAGLQDGYLISVMYDDNDIDPGTGWIICSALVNGAMYTWNPEVGTVYDVYASLFVR
jgi:hypothetical protein